MLQSDTWCLSPAGRREGPSGPPSWTGPGWMMQGNFVDVYFLLTFLSQKLMKHRSGDAITRKKFKERGGMCWEGSAWKSPRDSLALDTGSASSGPGSAEPALAPTGSLRAFMVQASAKSVMAALHTPNRPEYSGRDFPHTYQPATCVSLTVTIWVHSSARSANRCCNHITTREGVC